MTHRLRHAAKNPWISIGPQIGPRQFESDPLKPSRRLEIFELIGENLVDAPGLEPGTPACEPSGHPRFASAGAALEGLSSTVGPPSGAFPNLLEGRGTEKRSKALCATPALC